MGPMDQVVYGIGGQAPAAITQVPSLTMGNAKFENRQLLSVDLFKRLGRGLKAYGAIFGADFMRETDAVITYREQKVFLQTD